MRRLSENGLAFIKNEEGCILHLYDCPAGHCTIGVGHLVHKGACDGRAEEKPYAEGISAMEAELMLKRDAALIAEGPVSRLVKVPLTQNQFDALCSFVFNLGSGALAGSTLLRKLNQGDYAGAAAEFPRWVYADGRKLEGLVERRDREQTLFLK